MTSLFDPLKRPAKYLVAGAILSASAIAQTTSTQAATKGIAERIVNAPVSPEAIYVGRKGGMSVIDLNGFGQGTGSYRLFRDGNYNYGFKRNPNLGQPGIVPTLSPGRSNLDAGSSGALTLSLDAGESTLVFDGTTQVDDIQIGQPLDLVYNNANINAFIHPGNQVNPETGLPSPGNTIAIAPHPNPPRLVRPAPNPFRGIEAEEPTVTSYGPVAGRITVSPPCIGSTRNKLVIGDPFSLNQTSIGVFHANYDGVFYGPQPAPPSPPPPIPYCPHTSRQQIGHFVYVLDRAQKQVVVANSNRMKVLERITLPSPSSLAIAPHLALLAVSNEAHGTVSFIDTNPLSRRFHKVLATVRVGAGPTKMAWQPESEALHICNTAASTMTIIDGQTYVARSLPLPAKNPIDVAVSSRQFRLGLKTWTYFAYILNRDGSLDVYESGPRPIGPDLVRATGLKFASAKSLHIGASLAPTCYIAHKDSRNVGQVSVVETRISAAGTRSWHVQNLYGGSGSPINARFSGNDVIAIAFDEMKNRGAHREYRSALLPSLPQAEHSGKSLARLDGATVVKSYEPRFLFVALADSETVDAINLSNGRVVRSLKVPGVRSLGHYWAQ